MHHHIKRLVESAEKESRLIMGLMSGTSLDGLDIALCNIKGCGTATEVEVLQFTTCEYPEQVKEKIRRVFAKSQVDLEYLTLLNGWLGTYHGQLIVDTLARWDVKAQEVDVIASHGQTIYHCPAHQHEYSEFGNGTLQIADADHIAVMTHITTLSDFRQKHIAAGGEGAPLAHYGDYYYFSSKKEHRLLLNIGGIANLTYLPKNCSFSDVLCSDIGAGNTIMDAYMQRHFQVDYDQNGDIANAGKVSEALLESLMAVAFIKRDMPKTTGPEVFNLALLSQAQTDSNTEHLSHNDVMATLNSFSAKVIVEHITLLSSCILTGNEPVNVYVSGGGYHNTLLMAQVESQLSSSCNVMSSQALGINPDAKEAVLFAILANETLVGDSASVKGESNQSNPITMGKISFPD
ncbi:anhydro-N-acetylmuramic acid kinase [Pseudoalteromonas citrea]|uniref:Anhydro-N-acetylmuramic acid kinase n=2 Tax=Pseudoalteromonas citrea TaxID=43655 RepID=A0AAD4ADZ2_9GAMM|nr:anhydro-N-acetylmuramic acid kinase [Pseudoalteromonas citrea]KAF7764195.1 anhydro-N-acetylmuramic acid kinase [Pseudoalteromonas citrea]